MKANACILSIAHERMQWQIMPMRIRTASMLGELVRDQRKQRGWSQSELAHKSGVSRLWIGQFENGKETVELGKVLKTLHSLDLSLEAGLLRQNPLSEGLLKP
jgi:y4mF family transcriptional regulator